MLMEMIALMVRQELFLHRCGVRWLWREEIFRVLEVRLGLEEGALAGDDATQRWEEDVKARAARSAKYNSTEAKRKRREKAHQAAIELEGTKRFAARGGGDTAAATAGGVEPGPASTHQYGADQWEQSAALAKVATAKEIAEATATAAAGGVSIRRSGREIPRCNRCQQLGHKQNSFKCKAAGVMPQLVEAWEKTAAEKTAKEKKKKKKKNEKKKKKGEEKKRGGEKKAKKGRGGKNTNSTVA
jgi:hypothetical protein